MGLTLFIMQQVAPGPHKMAHYAFGSSLANLGVMLPGMASGWLCDQVGYHRFFLLALMATIPIFSSLAHPLPPIRTRRRDGPGRGKGTDRRINHR